MRKILVVVVMLSAFPAAASELRKCVAADGAVSYLDRDCPEGSRQAWSRDVKALVAPAPEKTLGPANKPAAARPRTPPVRSVGAAPSRAPTARDRAKARCEAARRDADEQRDRLWNRLSFEQRSALDAKVARACAR